MLDLVGVQDVRRGKGDTERAGDYNIFYGKENDNQHLGTGFLYTTEFVSDRLSYKVVRGRWLNIIVLIVPATSK
jgi:hypothetical protein